MIRENRCHIAKHEIKGDYNYTNYMMKQVFSLGDDDYDPPGERGEENKEPIPSAIPPGRKGYFYRKPN